MKTSVRRGLRSMSAVGAAASVAIAAAAMAAPASATEQRPRALQVAFMSNGSVVNPGAVLSTGADFRIRGVPAGSTVVVRTLTSPSVDVTVSPSPRDQRVWIARSLPPATTLWAKVTTATGESSKVRFRTPAPLGRFTASISPERGKYGVGVPVEIDFSMPITDKAAVESALSVRSDKDLGPTSWSWLDNDTIAFRPKTYWPAHASISVRANLDGVQGAPGYYGTDAVRHFQTGAEVILKTRIDRFTMSVWRDGEKVKTYDISSGKPGWETASGIKVITEKYREKRLWNPDPENGWDVTVPWAIRITWNGEFIHSAPWNYYLGQANISHGCTNMSVADAKEVFDMVRYGDIVEATGSPKQVEAKDVTGDWNTPWFVFRQGSALR